MPSSLRLVYNLGVFATSGQDSTGEIETHTYFDYSAALSYGGNPLFATFLEAFGTAPISGNGSSSFSLGGGITSLVLSNLQLDASGGVNITDSATDWFVGVGFSVRFPR